MFFYIFLIIAIRLIADYAFRLGNFSRYSCGFLLKFAKKGKNPVVSNYFAFNANYAIGSSAT